MQTGVYRSLIDRCFCVNKVWPLNIGAKYGEYVYLLLRPLVENRNSCKGYETMKRMGGSIMCMNRCFVCFATFTALFATGLVFETDPAVAQQVSEGKPEIAVEAVAKPEIVVEAPILRAKIGRSGRTGADIEIIELRRRISYSDLDLRKQADVTELETRIEITSKEACEKLAKMFPLTSLDKGEVSRCTDQAVDGTEEQVQAAIAFASR